MASGLLVPGDQPGLYLCERAMFWQLPQPWLGDVQAGAYPQQMQISDGKRHPRRAPKPRGEVYRRFDARLGAWVSLRTLEIEQDPNASIAGRTMHVCCSSGRKAARSNSIANT